MLVFLFFILVAGAVIFLAPSWKLKVIFGLYFFGLYILMFGIAGLVETRGEKEIEITVVNVVNFIVIFIQLPLIYYLYKIDHNKHKEKKAREIFDKDIWNLDERNLREHLRHK